MHEFQPTLLWAIALLPLLGFVVNGIAAFAGRPRIAPAAHGHEHGHGETDEPEHTHGHDAHDTHAAHAHDDAHAHGTSPLAGRKLIPTLVGPGVVIAAFVIALINFMGMMGAELHEPIVETY